MTKVKAFVTFHLRRTITERGGDQNVTTRRKTEKPPLWGWGGGVF